MRIMKNQVKKAVWDYLMETLERLVKEFRCMSAGHN